MAHLTLILAWRMAYQMKVDSYKIINGIVLEILKTPKSFNFNRCVHYLRFIDFLESNIFLGAHILYVLQLYIGDEEARKWLDEPNSSISGSETESVEFKINEMSQNGSVKSNKSTKASSVEKKDTRNSSKKSLSVLAIPEESRRGSEISKSSNESSTSTGSEEDSSFSASESSSSSEDDEPESSASSEKDEYSIDGENGKKESVNIVVEQEEVSRIKIRRRFTLPFIFNYIAWILCLGTILVSVFYIWAYGVMFGNDKTYQWLTSTLAYFWSGMLIVEPFKVT